MRHSLDSISVSNDSPCLRKRNRNHCFFSCPEKTQAVCSKNKKFTAKKRQDKSEKRVSSVVQTAVQSSEHRISFSLSVNHSCSSQEIESGEQGRGSLLERQQSVKTLPWWSRERIHFMERRRTTNLRQSIQEKTRHRRNKEKRMRKNFRLRLDITFSFIRKKEAKAFFVSGQEFFLPDDQRHFDIISSKISKERQRKSL